MCLTFPKGTVLQSSNPYCLELSATKSYVKTCFTEHVTISDLGALGPDQHFGLEPHLYYNLLTMSYLEDADTMSQCPACFSKSRG